MDFSGENFEKIDSSEDESEDENTNKKSTNNNDSLGESMFDLAQSNITVIKAMETSEIQNSGNKEEKNKALLKTGKLVKQETRSTGQVTAGVYLYYFRSIGFFNILGVLLLYTLYIFLNMTIDYWVANWAEEEKSGEAGFYRLVYFGLIVLLACLLFIKSYFYGIALSTASFQMFNQLINNIVGRPMRFFDTTETGTILNRCSSDMAVMDMQIPRFV